MKVGLRNRERRQFYAMNILLETKGSDLTVLKARAALVTLPVAAACGSYALPSIAHCAVPLYWFPPSHACDACMAQGILDDGGDYHTVYKCAASAVLIA